MINAGADVCSMPHMTFFQPIQIDPTVIGIETLVELFRCLPRTFGPKYPPCLWRRF